MRLPTMLAPVLLVVAAAVVVGALFASWPVGFEGAYFTRPAGAPEFGSVTPVDGSGWELFAWQDVVLTALAAALAAGGLTALRRRGLTRGMIGGLAAGSVAGIIVVLTAGSGLQFAAAAPYALIAALGAALLALLRLATGARPVLLLAAAGALALALALFLPGYIQPLGPAGEGVDGGGPAVYEISAESGLTPAIAPLAVGLVGLGLVIAAGLLGRAEGRRGRRGLTPP